MPVKIRPALTELQSYRPSRTPRDLLRERGMRAAVNLAFNEGPYGPLPSVVDAISEAVARANRYPDMNCGELLRRLAERFGVDPAGVRVGAGSFALFRHLVDAVVDTGDEVVFGWPTFEEYAAVTVIAGGRPVPVPLLNHTYDLDGMAAAITPRTRMAVVCNPNNPTGTAVGAGELRRFLDRVPPEVTVVIDEAYGQFVTDPSVPNGFDYVPGTNNVAVLRTFSKAYGLAGIRVGYCVSSPRLADALGKVITPFSVSAMAQAAAIASLEPVAEAQLMQRVAGLVSERERLALRLSELDVDVPPSQANFLWLPLGAQAVPCAELCEDNGVIVRAFAGNGIRVTVGTPKENDLFLEAVAEALSGIREPTAI